MPRKPRMYLPGVPCHVIQRGNNRDATFFAEQDYQFYLVCLYEAARKYHVKIHAYVLMTNHVHLLMTPQLKESISLVMQSIGRRYVQYINKEYRRTGTLWESRHKESLIDGERYLLVCSRYIEMNPVSANMVKHPSQYKWTSYMCNAHGVFNKLICHHEVYSRLGVNEGERQKTYASLFDDVMDVKEFKIVRNAVRFSMPTGDSRFQKKVEQAINRKIGYSHRGRPRRSCKAECK
ncbi:MAG: transposase [Gammaproteobacteria bacterium]|nr:transposase [Gammaproteobacteria bacterium]